MIYPIRKWALFSLVEWSGKTTFLASNLETPCFYIDGDNRLQLVESLIDGEVIKATWQALTDPLALIQETRAAFMDKQMRSVVCDPVTKLYSAKSREAAMAGRLKPAEREKRGYGKNVAKLHVGKADMIESIANLAMYGVSLYVSWHQRKGSDSKGNIAVRDRISEVELNVLRQSIDVELKFGKKVNPAWQENKSKQEYLYSVQVVTARGIGGKRANTGFTIWDAPNNFWRGASSQLERLMYTTFSGPDDAIIWAAKEKKGVDWQKEYEDLKEKIKPEHSGIMYASWVSHVDSLARSGEPDLKIEKPVQATTVAGDAMYEDGKTVPPDLVDDCQIYRKKFGRLPYDEAVLVRAKESSLAKDDWN